MFCNQHEQGVSPSLGSSNKTGGGFRANSTAAAASASTKKEILFLCTILNLITLILQFHGCLQLLDDSKKDIRDDGDGKNNGDE